MLTQLLCHLFGDYLLQSSWMAANKVKRLFPAIIHACVYFIPFWIVFHPSLTATAVIICAHAVIDRYRLAKYVAFAKEYLAPRKEWKLWRDCSETGYHKDFPVWLSAWLMIIVDNTLHLTINALVLIYL